VAITVSVPPAEGAVYRPAELMVPKPALQVTAVLLLPLTEALNCTVPRGWTRALPGLRLMLTGVGVEV